MRLYDDALAKGELQADDAQANAACKLSELANALGEKRGFWLLRKTGLGLFGRHSQSAAPKGLYIWGDVGRGKTLLMDLFFAAAPVAQKRRAHFNAFMVDVHARIHAERQRAGSSDPIPLVARASPKRHGCSASTNSRSPMWPTP